GKCESSAAANATQKLINANNVDALITFCALETITVAPIAERGEKLLLAPAASSPNITHAGDYIFRYAPSDAVPAKDLAKLLSDNYERVAIITETSDFSEGF